MDYDRKMAILTNDLDSMVHRIESLPDHPGVADALNSVIEVKSAIEFARADMRKAAMIVSGI